MSNKMFWRIVNSAESKTAEIFIYGNIVGETNWKSPKDDLSPSDFANKLAMLNGKAINLRINSNGGNVFAANAIASLIKSYKGKTVAIIDGLAASAATIIAMAADKIVMPVNSLMMIHDPMVCLTEPMNESELQQCIDMLKPIKESIIASYKERCKLSDEELATMMAASTWMTAAECLKHGFADEIQGKLQPVMDGNVLVVNSIRHELNNEDAKVVKSKIEIEEETNVNNDALSLFTKAANALGLTVTAKGQPIVADNGGTADPEPVNNVGGVTAQEPVNAADAVAAAVAAERQRINDLDAADDVNNALLHKIINNAKAKGQTLADIQDVLDIVTDEQKNPSAGAQFMQNLVDDQKQSGINNVNAQPDNGMTEEQVEAMRQERMVKAMQKLF